MVSASGSSTSSARSISRAAAPRARAGRAQPAPRERRPAARAGARACATAPRRGSCRRPSQTLVSARPSRPSAARGSGRRAAAISSRDPAAGVDAVGDVRDRDLVLGHARPDVAATSRATPRRAARLTPLANVASPEGEHGHAERLVVVAGVLAPERRGTRRARCPSSRQYAPKYRSIEVGVEDVVARRHRRVRGEDARRRATASRASREARPSLLASAGGCARAPRNARVALVHVADRAARARARAARGRRRCRARSPAGCASPCRRRRAGR